MEQLRTVFFIGILTALLITIGALLGGMQGVWIALGFAILINGFSYFFSDKLVLWMYKAKPLAENTTEGSRVYPIVRHVSSLMKIPMPALFFVEEVSPNAFATGRDPNHAAVVFTRGILGLLNDHELEGVIAHELSHVKNRDILVASIAAVIAGAIGTLAHMLMWSGMSGSDREGRNPIGMILIAISIPIIAMLIQLAVSRSREYLADESAAHTLHSGHALASALHKLETGIHKRPFEDANAGTAHLFIANPFSAEGITGLFSTHPPMKERIARLQKIR